MTRCSPKSSGEFGGWHRKWAGAGSGTSATLDDRDLPQSDPSRYRLSVGGRLERPAGIAKMKLNSCERNAKPISNGVCAPTF